MDKIITTLRSSSSSRFEGKEKIITISYRRYEGSSGKIMELYHSALGHEHIYARRYASWEFHPIRTRESFDNEYNENPEKADCIYGSTDSGTFIDSWIKDSRRIKAAMRTDRDWIIDWPLPYETTVPGSEEWLARETHREWRNSPMSEHSYTDHNGIYRELDPYNIPIKVKGDPSKHYVFVGDPALGSEVNGGDGYGVCLAHRVPYTHPESGIKYYRPVIDFVFRFTGRMFEEGQVQMQAIENLIISLKEYHGYNIKVFSFDGWNSASLTQTLAKRYKDTTIYDRAIVGIEEYTALRDSIFGEAPPTSGKGEKERNGGIDMPWHPILYEELRELRESRDKRRVDHPNNNTKDMADTLARAVRVLLYLWPYQEVLVAGTNVATGVEDNLYTKLRNHTATQDEKLRALEQAQGHAAGLGDRWRPSSSERAIDFTGNILPDL